jgi:adenylyltransferase/sulfurtransferase
MLQATEAIKLIAGVGEPLIGRLLIVDAKRMRFRTIEVRRDPSCPVCGTREQRTLIDYEAFCGMPSAGTPARELEIEPRALAERIASVSPPLLIDVREPWEFEIAHLPEAQLRPGSTLDPNVPGIPRDRDVVLYCHSGQRSYFWLTALRDRGFDRVAHLRGGIDAWSRQVDPSVPRY